MSHSVVEPTMWTGIKMQIWETIIITGGNTGLGFASAVHCLREGAALVIVTSRDTKKGSTAVMDIQRQAGSVKGRVEVWELDLTQRASIEAFVQRASQLSSIDRVLENAGLANPYFQSVNGIEVMTAVSVYGTFELLWLLMPLLRKSGKATGRKPTVTIVSSELHRMTSFPERNSTNIIASLSDKKQARILDRYNVLKLIQVMLTMHLAELLNQQTGGKPDVILNCCSPGLVNTELQRSLGILGRIMKFVMHAYTPEVGSLDLVNILGADASSHGKYMVYCKYEPVSALARSPEGKEKARQMWAELAKQLNMPEDHI